MKLRDLTKISQTTISGLVGVFGMLAYELLPYLSKSTNPKVQMIAFVLGVLGFGNGLRAAPDQNQAFTADQLDGKNTADQLMAGDLVEEHDGETVKREPQGDA